MYIDYAVFGCINSLMEKINLSLLVLGMIMIVLLSEAVYILSHRDLFSKYSLVFARQLFKADLDKIGFYVVTGANLKMPEDHLYQVLVSDYFEKNDESSLPYVLYKLALISLETKSEHIFPELLEYSISRDPDFSFWRIELANYYLSKGNFDLSEKTLDDCLHLSAPREHCLYYKESIFDSKVPEPAGFLRNEIETFYSTNKNI